MQCVIRGMKCERYLLMLMSVHKKHFWGGEKNDENLIIHHWFKGVLEAVEKVHPGINNLSRNISYYARSHTVRLDTQKTQPETLFWYDATPTHHQIPYFWSRTVFSLNKNNSTFGATVIIHFVYVFYYLNMKETWRGECAV